MLVDASANMNHFVMRHQAQPGVIPSGSI